MSFDKFNIDSRIVEAISYMGIEKPTKIQELGIPEILSGNDLLACAQTGTGKTATFVLPILHEMINIDIDGIMALIVVPTRELAQQIDQEIQAISYFLNIQSIAIYGGGGGQDFEKEKNVLQFGKGIVIATPGRLKAHLNLGYVDFSKIKFFVLDEADRMLDIGFLDDILQIMKHLPEKRQTLMFSATMPPKVRNLAKKIMPVKPKEISLEISKPAEGVLQATYLVYDSQKIPLIHSLINNKTGYDSILIFTSTKKKVNEILKSLKQTEKSIGVISSDLEQTEREAVLLKFKTKQTRVLVATDVISRGIDVKDINLVINFDVPNDAEDYVHRIGRTARAKSTGVAITLINEADMYRFSKIEQLIERKIIRIPVPKELGDSPVWNISKNTKSRTNKKRYKKK